MASYRMAFRAGSRGQELWPICRELGVAAIYYDGFDGIDLSKYHYPVPKDRWGMLFSSEHASLRRVAYEMKNGDTIYVKQGPKIVGKGTVKGTYKFDSKHRIVDEYGNHWVHQVPVKWDLTFPELNVLLGAERLTVKVLGEDALLKIERALKQHR